MHPLKKIPAKNNRSRKMIARALMGMGVLALFMVATTHFDITSQVKGIFLLKGKKGSLFELKDDLYLGDGSRLISGVDFGDPRFSFFSRMHRHKPGEAYLYYEWNRSDGSGFVRNFMPGGEQLLTCFARYEENESEYVHGLFVGGGLPAGVQGDDAVKMAETGMAYFDGKRWYHVWCSVNEAITPGDSGGTILPSRWKFLGSKVLKESDKGLAIMSSHAVDVAGVPLRMDRYAYFRAGDPYFILSVVIRNIGGDTASFVYCYGDDPWVGDFGSSAGNVGWVKDGTINFEQSVDPYKYDFAGMYDYGNSVLGKGHHYTMTANFIEWLGSNRPDLVFFSNAPGSFSRNEGMDVPLASNERFIGLQWGPHELKPGRSESFTLAVGMAGYDPKTGFPVKPEIKLKDVP